MVVAQRWGSVENGSDGGEGMGIGIEGWEMGWKVGVVGRRKDCRSDVGAIKGEKEMYFLAHIKYSSSQYRYKVHLKNIAAIFINRWVV